jgi:hypothetical protein
MFLRIRSFHRLPYKIGMFIGIDLIMQGGYGELVVFKLKEFQEWCDNGLWDIFEKFWLDKNIGEEK